MLQYFYFALISQTPCHVSSHGTLSSNTSDSGRQCEKAAPSALWGHSSDGTAYRILNTFWNHFTNDIPDQRFMHDVSSHSTFRESFDFAMRRKRFLEVSHSNCLCQWVVKGHLSPLTVRSEGDIKRRSVLWDELGLIALLLFSAGSRTTFTQIGGGGGR